MVVVLVICFCICFAGSSASSIGSPLEESLQCSKYHFEEKVLEKLVRLELKMEMYEAKIKYWEDSIPTYLDKIDHANRRTETFLESMQNILTQEQTRLNESFHETVENIYLNSEGKINSDLESKIGEFENKSESALEFWQSSLVQDQTRFNETVTNMYTQSESKVKGVLDSVSSKMDEFSKSHKNGEHALELMKSSVMQDQARFNTSFHDTVKNVYIQSESKVKGVLDSVSSKMDEFSKSHKNGEHALELMKSSVMQDQARFNTSFHDTVKNVYIQLESKLKGVLDSVSSKMDEFSKSHKNGEHALELMKSSVMQDQARFNKSFHGTVKNVYIQSESKVKGVLDSVSSKMDEFSKSHRKGKDDLQLFKSTILQMQELFNKSFDMSMNKIETESKNLIQNFSLEHKNVGLFGCYSGGQSFQPGTVVKFSSIKASTGIHDLNSFQSTGKFNCAVPGFYMVSVVIMSSTNEAHYEITKNDNRILHIYPIRRTTKWSTSSTNVVSANLHVNDTISIKTLVSMTIDGDGKSSCISIIKI